MLLALRFEPSRFFLKGEKVISLIFMNRALVKSASV